MVTDIRVLFLSTLSLKFGFNNFRSLVYPDIRLMLEYVYTLTSYLLYPLVIM